MFLINPSTTLYFLDKKPCIFIAKHRTTNTGFLAYASTIKKKKKKEGLYCVTNYHCFMQQPVITTKISLIVSCAQISGETASATVNSGLLSDLSNLSNASLYGFEDYHGVDIGVVKAVRLWYTAAVGEMPIEIQLKEDDTKLGFAISRTDEVCFLLSYLQLFFKTSTFKYAGVRIKCTRFLICTVMCTYFVIWDLAEAKCVYNVPVIFSF